MIAAGGIPFQRHDPDLLAQVPSDVEVIRPVDPGDWWQRLQRRRTERFHAQQRSSGSTGSSEHATGKATRLNVRAVLRHAVHRAESWYYHPDMERHWIEPATQATVQACGENACGGHLGNGTAVVFVPGGGAGEPRAPGAVRAGLPHLVDDSFRARSKPAPGVGAAAGSATLRRLLAGARAVTFFYAAEAECFWRMYRGALDASRIHVIPNGSTARSRICSAAGETFTLLYTGVLGDYRYDTFLQALALFKRANPTRGGAGAKFVGEQEAESSARVEELGFRTSCRLHSAGAARADGRPAARRPCAADAGTKAVPQGRRAPGGREAVQLLEGGAADYRCGSGRRSGANSARRRVATMADAGSPEAICQVSRCCSMAGVRIA